MRNYQLFLPIDYEVIIPKNDSVRLLSLIMEELDYTEIYKAYSQDGRNPAVEPKIFVKVMVYAYMEYVYSTRKIGSAFRRNINFMWLLNGEAAPNHSTISRFRKDRLGVAIEGLFYQFVQKLCELGEVKYEDVFVDGAKIEVTSNRYSFVWKKAILKNEAEMAVFLEKKKSEKNINFVYGSGKRKSNLQKLLEALYSYQVRQQGDEETRKYSANTIVIPKPTKMQHLCE